MNIDRVNEILENILAALMFMLVYVMAIFIFVLVGILSYETYMWVDEMMDLTDDILPFACGSIVLGLGGGFFGLYARFVIIPYERMKSGGGSK